VRGANPRKTRALFNRESLHLVRSARPVHLHLIRFLLDSRPLEGQVGKL
jgi:hypothetical protein